jgi:nitroimidazol reductase NimA-like FMN-containing flavoprotein (pyridoxamine 5'-phosphate oxidase superfamily)
MQPARLIHPPSATDVHPRELDRSGLEILDRDECFRLLATATVGRIGLTVGALPVVLPVSFRLQGDRIVFVAAVGSTLDAATRDAVVAFEADDVEPATCAGWSVTGTGVARDASAAELIDFAEAGLPRWAAWGDDRLVVVSTEMLSGRRIGRRSGTPWRAA